MTIGPRERFWAAIALIALVCCAFLQTLRFDFLTVDDPAYVVDNPHVREGLTPDSIRWAFTASTLGHWHPLTHLSYMADFMLYGLNPAGFHFTNVLLHALNTVLLFALLARMTRAPGCSFVVAALFAIHPLHVESVAWIAERKDLLSAFFALATIYGYVAWVEKSTTARYAAVMLLFALAATSKGIVVTLSCLLLLLDYWPLQRINSSSPAERGFAGGWALRSTRLVIEKLPLFAISAAVSWATVWASRQAAAVRDLEGLPLDYRFANAAVSYFEYLKRTVWPANLAAFYPHLHGALSTVTVIVAAAALLLITAVALLTVRTRPYIIVGWLWFLGVILPVSGLFQVGDQAMADRYTYFSLIGVFIAAVWTIAELLKTRPTFNTAGLAVSAVVILAFTTAAYRQTAYWRDTVTLYTHALAVTPDNGVTRQILANAYLMQNRPGEAATHYRAALALYPDHAGWNALLGYALYLQGDHSGAREHYNLALALDPDNAETLNNLGILELEMRDYAAAQTAFHRVVALRPNHEGPLVNLAIALAAQERFDEAAQALDQALDIDPDSLRAHLNYASMLLDQSRPQDAIPHLEHILTIDPAHAQARAQLVRAQTVLMSPPARRPAIGAAAAAIR